MDVWTSGLPSSQMLLTILWENAHPVKKKNNNNNNNKNFNLHNCYFLSLSSTQFKYSRRSLFDFRR